MSWIITVIIGIIFVLFLYLKFGRNITTPSTGMDSIKVINFIGWAVFLIAIPIMFAPEFWERFYNYQYFWLVMALLAFAVFMYSYHSYTRWLGAILLIVGLIVYNFGDFKSSTKKSSASQKKEVRVTIEDKPTGQKYYLTLTADEPSWRGSIPSSDMDITPDCGQNIIVEGDIWTKSDTLYGCTKGEVDWPQYRNWIRISIF